jgi:CheY-like chemotaxis protein
MALVLCTGVYPVLIKTRKLIFEHAGHTVIPCTDELQLVAACEEHAFDVAVIGQAVSRKVTHVIRLH